MIFYESAHRYKQFILFHNVTGTKYVCMIVLTILLLDLQFCFMNYDCVFRSYNSVFHDKNVLFMQHKL